MTKWLSTAAAVAVCVCGWVNAAEAAPVTQQFFFKAFFDASNPNSPLYGQVSGYFTVTFDPLLSIQGPIDVGHYWSSLPTNYEPVVFSTIDQTATVGNYCSNAGSCAVIGGHDTFSFTFQFDDEGSSLGGLTFMFSQTKSSGVYTVPVTVVSPVPLPSSAPMFCAALLTLACLGHTKRRGAKSAA